MEVSQNTSPTGNKAFDRTMLMMEIDKRDIELDQLSQQLKFQTKTVEQMAEVLKVFSMTMTTAIQLTDADWQEFRSLLDKYAITGETQLADLESSCRGVLQEFLRYKLGSSIIEKIG